MPRPVECRLTLGRVHPVNEQAVVAFPSRGPRGSRLLWWAGRPGCRCPLRSCRAGSSPLAKPHPSSSAGPRAPWPPPLARIWRASVAWANRTGRFKISTAQHFEPQFWDPISLYPTCPNARCSRAATNGPRAEPWTASVRPPHLYHGLVQLPGGNPLCTRLPRATHRASALY